MAVCYSTRDGTITFTPTTGYSGDATFDYTVSDGNGGIDTATVTVTVDDPLPPPNTAPIATDDSGNTEHNTAIIFTATELLDNDTDADSNDTLVINAVNNAVNGSVLLNTDGTITFTPTAGYSGDATFDYTVSDGNGGIDTATVTVTVDDPLPPPNTAQIATDDSGNTEHNTAIIFTAAELLDNDTDADSNDTLVNQRR